METFHFGRMPSLLCQFVTNVNISIIVTENAYRSAWGVNCGDCIDNPKKER